MTDGTTTAPTAPAVIRNTSRRSTLRSIFILPSGAMQPRTCIAADVSSRTPPPIKTGASIPDPDPHRHRISGGLADGRIPDAALAWREHTRPDMEHLQHPGIHMLDDVLYARERSIAEDDLPYEREGIVQRGRRHTADARQGRALVLIRLEPLARRELDPVADEQDTHSGPPAGCGDLLRAVAEGAEDGVDRRAVRLARIGCEVGLMYSQTRVPSVVTSKRRPKLPSQISVLPFGRRVALEMYGLQKSIGGRA